MHAESMQIEGALRSELERLGIPAVPVVVPTRWAVGPVAAYLFPDDPVTLVDATIDSSEARQALGEALSSKGLQPSDVYRVIVTHGHTDHYGGAVWLQQEASCEVLVHQADIDVTGRRVTSSSVGELLGPLGFPEDLIARNFSSKWEWSPPQFTPLRDGDVFMVGSTKLRIDHRPGHTPGHVWITDNGSGAIFVGDYLLAGHATNAGMEIDPQHPSGRVPLLERYTQGLRELRDRAAPALFPAHGPPITNHAELIDRRLAKSSRRTRHVLDGLRKAPSSSALDLGRHLYGSRPERSWEVVADLVGRVDLLVAEGRARSHLGEDGVWYFSATDEGEDQRHA